MRRSTCTPRPALGAFTAAAAAVALAAGPALTVHPGPARLMASARGAAPGAPSCRPSDLRVSAPAAIKGDPAVGMGKQAWNLVFRNVSRADCTLRGWPGVTVRGPAGGKVATTVSDVEFTNLAVVPEAPVRLAPGGSAVVTGTSPAASGGCVTGWTLGLTLPGAGRPVTVHGPGGSFAPCVGAKLNLSPFYPEKTLDAQIEGLKVSDVPPPFTATTAARPPACPAADLAARITSAQSAGGGALIELRLTNAGRTCVLSEGWPTVRVRVSRGAGQVAKILPDTSALAAEKSLLVTYTHGTAQSTALTLTRGGSVSIALLSARAGGEACRRLASLTVYPSVVDRGRGLTARPASAVSICGTPRILSFLPAGRQAGTIARGAFDAIRADPDTSMLPGDSRGFYYGTDSAAPDACGSGPYTEPDGDCGNGTEGPYGEYIGEIGSFMYWKGCTASGLNWVQSNYNMANDNLVDYHEGLGAAAYWFAAGPGRDPHYNGTAAEAAAWGQQQAQRALSDLSGLDFDFRYIFMDIENNGLPPDQDGWNTIWNGTCGNTVEAGYISASLDYATWQGFASYIDAHSPYLAGIYSAGGVGYGSWGGIFGSEPVGDAAEWTFTAEQSEMNFPSGFSGSDASAEWFGGAPAACHLMWQWSGGNGVLNGYGDLDQAEAANNASPGCSATAASSRQSASPSRFRAASPSATASPLPGPAPTFTPALSKGAPGAGTGPPG